MSKFCKFCKSINFIKSGFKGEHQRYHCKDCHKFFTNTPARGRPEALKALAVLLLYGMGNATYGMIAKLVGVSDVAVYKWIKKASEKLPEPVQDEATQLIQIDEMWHFVDGKKTKFGSGKPLILLIKNSSDLK